MSTLELSLAATAVLVGVLASRWNPTAAAMVASWAFGAVALYGFGYWMTLEDMFYCDLAVIAFVMGKPETCDLRPYRGFGHWLACRLLERSPWDRIVLLLFVPAWIAYAAPLADQARYRALWLIAMLQFAAAGGEALLKWRELRRAKAPARAAPDPPSAGLDFTRPAWGRAGGG